MIDDEHNNAHFTERFVLYRMKIIMHILQNISYERFVLYRMMNIITYAHNNAHFAERFV